MSTRQKVSLGLFILAYGLALGSCYAQKEEGLVGYWSFDEGKGEVARDSSGKKNDGEIVDAQWVKGTINNGLKFEGKGFVDCGTKESLNITNAITISAWIKPAMLEFSKYPAIVRKEKSYALRFSPDGRLGLLVWIEDKAMSAPSNKTNWEQDKWYHIAGTYNGSQIKVFIDGIEDKSVAQQGNIDITDNSCFIGSVGGQYQFNGMIDEVRIYNRALSADEIKDSFLKTKEKAGEEPKKTEVLEQKPVPAKEKK